MPQLITRPLLDDQPQLDSRHDSPVEGSIQIPATMPSVSRDCHVQFNSTSNKDALPKSRSSYLFVVVNDPSQLKDPEKLRKVRRKVMENYFEKHPPKPRHRPIRQTRNSLTSSRPSPVRDGMSLAEFLKSRTPADFRLAHTLVGSENPFEDYRLPRFLYKVPLNGGTPYLLAQFDSLPSPVPTRHLNIFPRLDDPLIVKSTDALKLSCARHFASQGLKARVIPTLLKAKHGFLSTLCIASAHDDVMQRGARPLHERGRLESQDRIRIKVEVISLINRALSDPSMRSADVTAIAILNVLCSEIIGCDEHALGMHQRGLRGLVRERGGLHKLGMDGQLASIITIKMFIISALRERPPDPEYCQFASRQATKMFDAQVPIPESPLYCRSTGYETIKSAFRSNSQVYHLLELLRQLTRSLTQEKFSSRIPSSSGSAQTMQQSLASELYHQILAIPNAQQLHDAFENENERYTFETLRLTAIVYAHALTRRVPFSRAAIEVASLQPKTDDKSVSSSHGNRQSHLAMHVQIQHALQRTNFGQCWGDLIGVLFFVSLISGACANHQAAVNLPFGTLVSEEEESRKWLAAITMRCSLVLSFEHGPAVLETLKRLVYIEECLCENAPAQGTEAAEHTVFAREAHVMRPPKVPQDLSMPGSSLIRFPPWRPGPAMRFGPSEPPLAFDDEYPTSRTH